MGFGFNLKFGLGRGIAAAAADVVAWLLPFNLNGTATVPSDGTGDVTDGFADTTPRYPRVWDSTNGLVLSEVVGPAFISEGMRISYDTDEASLGSDKYDTWANLGTSTVDGRTLSLVSGDQPNQASATSRPVVGGHYRVSLTAVGISGGNIRVDYGGNTSAITITGDGEYSLEVEALTTVGLYIISLGGSGDITINDFAQIQPAFLNDTAKDSGIKLHPSKTGSNGEEIMLSFNDWADATVYAAGSYVVDFDSPHYKYYKTALGGTSSGTGVADDTGVTDWVEQGYYMGRIHGEGGIPFVINHPTYINYLLNSDTPATQTTGSLSTGTYTIYVDDAATGSATIAANTATIDSGGAATAGSPFTFTVTGAGTVDVTVAATVNKFQLNDTATRLPYTPTTSGTEQVDATYYTATWLGGLNNFAIRGRASVADINRNNYLFGITGTGTNILNLRLASGGGGITSTRFFDGVLDANITNTGSSVSQGEVFYWGVVVDDQGTGKVYFNGVASAGSFSADSFGALDTVALGRYTTSLVMNGGNTDVAVYTGSDLSDFASNITWDDPK